MEATLDPTGDQISAQKTASRNRDSGLVLDGKYEVLEELGRGASGIVYKALHLSMQKVVAIKIIDPQILPSASSVKRFQREAALLSTFDHANIVKFLGYGGLAD